MYYAVREEIKRLLDLDVIQESNSMFVTPAFLIVKRNGTVRLAVDYHKLNKMTIKETFPFPVLEEQLIMLRSAKFFS